MLELERERERGEIEGTGQRGRKREGERKRGKEGGEEKEPMTYTQVFVHSGQHGSRR
jgi:hypothetical protein